MSTHNILYHDKIRKKPCIFVFLSYRENSVGTQNGFEPSKINEPSVFEPSRFYRGFIFINLFPLSGSGPIAAVFNILSA